MVVTANRQLEPTPNKDKALVLWFEDVEMGHVSSVGEKNASLGGFTTTADAYRYFIQQAGLKSK